MIRDYLQLHLFVDGQESGLSGLEYSQKEIEQGVPGRMERGKVV
jgi:hypothetical protein